MTIFKIFFWISMACVAYTYFIYPLLIYLAARFFGWPIHPQGQFVGSVSFVLAAYNEESFIVQRLDELTDLLAKSRHDCEIIVVSDGSTDGTAVLARGHIKGRVRVLELPVNGGKAEALTCGCAAALGDVIVFADARQQWAPDALEHLLRNFADPEVGAVSGDLVVESDSGLMSGVGFYWRFEKWLRQTESLVHSTVGATGAISAVRRELFCPIPKGTLLDDVYWPLQVVLQRYRVVHEKKACAFDRLPERASDEFRRKLRTLSGNFQLLTRLPVALLPWRNPIWIQFVSHKLMRLVVPWALLIMFIVSPLLPAPFYRMAFMAQMAFYIFALMGIWQGSRTHSRLASAAGSFLVLNAAAWLAFWVWIMGKASTSWRKVLYQGSMPSPDLDSGKLRARLHSSRERKLD